MKIRHSIIMLACMCLLSCSNEQDSKKQLDKAVDWLANSYFNAESVSQAPRGGDFLLQCDKVLRGEAGITDYPFLQELLSWHWNSCYSRRVDKSVIRAFADAGADVNVKISHHFGLEAVAVAVEKEDVEIAEILLGHGANPNARCVAGSCLETAIGKHNEQIAALLINNGANVNEKQYGDTLLCQALENGCMKTARLLLEKGCPADSKSLALAISNGDLELVKLLVDKGADVNMAGTADYYTMPPLKRALEKEHADIAGFLIEKGADVNWKDQMGDSLATQILGNGNTRMTQFLIEHGADINSRDSSGNTLLILAIKADNTQFVRFLVDHGADINATDSFSNYALDIAEQKKNREIVDLLSSKGAQRRPREEKPQSMPQTTPVKEATDSRATTHATVRGMDDTMDGEDSYDVSDEIDIESDYDDWD